MSDDLSLLLERIAELAGELARAQLAMGSDGPITAKGFPDAVRAVIAERDRLRAVVARLWDTLTAVHSYAADPVGRTDLNGVAYLSDPTRLPPEIRALADDVLEQALDQLDTSGVMGGEETSDG